jgi:hypothetical protein
MEALLGEGVPWRIIMIFFALGIWSGLKAERKSRFIAENDADTEGVSEALDGEKAVEKKSPVYEHYSS